MAINISFEQKVRLEAGLMQLRADLVDSGSYIDSDVVDLYVTVTFDSGEVEPIVIEKVDLKNGVSTIVTSLVELFGDLGTEIEGEEITSYRVTATFSQEDAYGDSLAVAATILEVCAEDTAGNDTSLFAKHQHNLDDFVSVLGVDFLEASGNLSAVTAIVVFEDRYNDGDKGFRPAIAETKSDIDIVENEALLELINTVLKGADPELTDWVITVTLTGKTRDNPTATVSVAQKFEG